MVVSIPVRWVMERGHRIWGGLQRLRRQQRRQQREHAAVGRSVQGPVLSPHHRLPEAGRQASVTPGLFHQWTPSSATWQSPDNSASQGNSQFRGSSFCPPGSAHAPYLGGPSHRGPPSSAPSCCQHLHPTLSSLLHTGGRCRTPAQIVLSGMLPGIWPSPRPDESNPSFKILAFSDTSGIFQLQYGLLPWPWFQSLNSSRFPPDSAQTLS